MSNFKIKSQVPTDNDLRSFGDYLIKVGSIFKKTEIIYINQYILNAQINTSYTLVSTDSGKLVTLDNAAPINVIIESNTTIPIEIGSRIDFLQKGSGKVTFIEGSGVTIKSKNNNKAIAAQNVIVSLIKENTDIWYLIGDLIA